MEFVKCVSEGSHNLQLGAAVGSESAGVESFKRMRTEPEVNAEGSPATAALRIETDLTGNSQNSNQAAASPSSASTSTNRVILPSSPKARAAAARAERWGGLLLPLMMQESDESQRSSVLELCKRIAIAIPGDRDVSRDGFMTLMAALKDPLNTDLRRRIISGELPVQVLVTLGEKDLVNPVERKEMDDGFKERSKDTNLFEMQKATQTTSRLFPCPNCKVRDCSWVQRQTRSGDEPMTVICSCNNCNHQWRKY